MNQLEHAQALMRDIARVIKQLPEDQQERASQFLAGYLRLLEKKVSAMHKKTARAIERGLRGT